MSAPRAMPRKRRSWGTVMGLPEARRPCVRNFSPRPVDGGAVGCPARPGPRRAVSRRPVPGAIMGPIPTKSPAEVTMATPGAPAGSRRGNPRAHAARHLRLSRRPDRARRQPPRPDDRAALRHAAAGEGPVRLLVRGPRRRRQPAVPSRPARPDPRRRRGVLRRGQAIDHARSRSPSRAASSRCWSRTCPARSRSCSTARRRRSRCRARRRSRWSGSRSTSCADRRRTRPPEPRDPRTGEGR